MKCTVVVGGQYGSEGKGKVVSFISARSAAPFVVRCGGPNSGHTVDYKGQKWVLRQLPCGVVNPAATLILSAGCVVDEGLLLQEIEALEISRDRILVDPRCVLMDSCDRESERSIVDSIASTGSGTGSALVRRIQRNGSVRLAEASRILMTESRVEPTAPILHRALDLGREVIVEGNQGFGLSLLHGPSYPFTTSRDTTASAFCSEVGLSPRDVTDIVMVVRTFPIRVGGNSGPLNEETTWESVQRLSGAPEMTLEYTSVTRKVRRVGLFDFELFRQAVRYNRPTALAVMGIDRLDFRNTGAASLSDLTSKSRDFLALLEEAANCPVRYVGTGFSSNEAFMVESCDVLVGVK